VSAPGRDADGQDLAGATGWCVVRFERPGGRLALPPGWVAQQRRRLGGGPLFVRLRLIAGPDGEPRIEVRAMALARRGGRPVHETRPFLAGEVDSMEAVDILPGG